MRIMANFFSLASGTERETNPLLDNFNTNNSGSWNNNNSTSASGNGLILYRNEEIYNQKSLEIWNQSCLQFHPRFIHHHHYSSSSSSPAMMGPISTGSMMRSARGGLVTSGGMNCQDCGNQAKKDCAHLRCRSCCKTRGFECSTHVRSTWVPAAKRRERQQRQQQQQQRPQESQQLNESEKNGGGESDNQMISQKRQREKDYLACDITTSTGLELGQQFPAELHSPAMFRCVRVQSNDDTDEQLAYQTTVNIGGHLFKGILYDQGPETRQFPTPPGSKDSSANLMIAAANQPDNPVAGASLLETNALYSPPISAFLAGTQFYSTPRS